MNLLVLHPSPDAQWHALVSEAEHACAVRLSEELEHYLVALLMRFAKQPDLMSSVVALDFLRSLQLPSSMRQDLLRDTGDKCLLYSGLFPSTAERRRVRISYFVKLGQAAYTQLADLYWHTLFAALGEQFVSLMDVLHSMRELHNALPCLTPLQAEELFTDTGSLHASQVLQSYTSACPVRSPRGLQ